MSTMTFPTITYAINIKMRKVSVTGQLNKLAILLFI
ncbi:hypothetical protein T03_1463 [Trichinella britovi]|uniref:Uncharacterized protein n=1 Tax=Trichinella britovi TaxID=45882 RepID=A0A0V0ZHM2_TRIBR|nr:hypothetical protein T03_1463 [Trichinella britovi]